MSDKLKESLLVAQLKLFFYLYLFLGTCSQLKLYDLPFLIEIEVKTLYRSGVK